MAFWPVTRIAALAVVVCGVILSSAQTRATTELRLGQVERRIELKGTDGPIFGLAW